MYRVALSQPGPSRPRVHLALACRCNGGLVLCLSARNWQQQSQLTLDGLLLGVCCFIRRAIRFSRLNSVACIVEKTVTLEAIIPLPAHSFMLGAHPGETSLRPTTTAPFPLWPTLTNSFARLMD